MQWVSIGISAASLLFTVFGIVWLSAFKISTMEVKVNTMWDFLLKRGAAEGINASLLRLNSPLKITNEARAMLAHMRPALKELRAKLPKEISEQDLALEIERAFGNELVKTVCVPNRINLGLCVLIAIGLANGTDTLDTILDHTSGTITL